MTTQHVQQLAVQHARPLPWPITSPPRPPDAGPSPDHSPTLTEVAATPQELAHLQRSLITVQEHVTALVLEVARNRQRLGVLEALVQHLLGSAPLPAVVAPTSEVNVAESTAVPERRLLPAEVQARSRVTALIEYAAEARYVPVCPSQGLPPFAPDTPEWFDWLATLTSFRFVGQRPSFHAQRETRRGQHTRS